MKRLHRILLGLFLTLALLYLSFGGFIWWVMHQTPETVGRVMARIPAPVIFLGFPFETMWLHARSGDLNVGDSAPDFNLMKVDKSGAIRLSELNRQRPVVLVFGSYT